MPYYNNRNRRPDTDGEIAGRAIMILIFFAVLIAFL